MVIAFILFGSRACGDYRDDSDLDRTNSQGS